MQLAKNNAKALSNAGESPEEAGGSARQVPGSSAEGNEYVEVLRHSLFNGDQGEAVKGVELHLKNIAGSDIGRAAFKAVFYDARGNVISEIEKVMNNLEKDATRALCILSSASGESEITSYEVKAIGVETIPLPVASGNDKVEILSHFMGKPEFRMHYKKRLNLKLKNTSSITIATAIFDITIYDSEGKVMDTFCHKEYELRPNTSRSVSIELSRKDVPNIKIYRIALVKTVTADVERIRLRRHERRTTIAGEEKITGLVKNISDVRADAALAATFFDCQKEAIGSQVIVLRGIKPDSVKQFRFSFKPPEGDRVKSYSINIGDLIEQG